MDLFQDENRALCSNAVQHFSADESAHLIVAGVARLRAPIATPRILANPATRNALSRKPKKCLAAASRLGPFVVGLALLLWPHSAAAGTAEVSFSRDIQPLLAKHCFVCHGPADQQAGLAFHNRAMALAQADSGSQAIVPGQPEKSLLLARVESTDAELRMPHDAAPLSKQQILLLRRWIQQGAPYTRHWSFVPPARTPASVTSGGELPAAIDQLVQLRLDEVGLQPAPAAERRTLIRRLSIDLLGLLPDPQRVAEFTQDRSPLAYESLVDELLASKRFGERWGRHWLDLARYADSFGYERDDVRPNAWRYRDWVISSINRNQPYDQFILEQLAGDLLPAATIEQQIATGMHRMNIKNNESGINKEDYRNRETVDRVNTTATAMLGLTLGCAQCHSHKYDPISQAEFYQFYAFFNNVEEHDIDIEGTPRDRSQYEAALDAFQVKSKLLKKRQRVLGEMKAHSSAGAWLASLAGDDESLEDKLQPLELTDEVRTSLQLAASERTNGQQRAIAAYWQTLRARHDDAGKAISQLSVQERHLPKPYVMTLREQNKDRRTTHRLVRGDFKQRAEQVSAQTPGVLNPLTPRADEADRLDLARWLVSPSNPLVARVAVNHIWKHLFGSGIVASVDDFGTQGERPSHPELLDRLAVELIESGWNRKHVIKSIVMSATYRQSSAHTAQLAVLDPENRLLTRQSRYRVESEIVRDLFLDAAGLIHHQLGGPTIHPWAPPATKDLAYKYKTRWIVSDKPNRFRRGMYIHFKRTNPYPSLVMFDSPESNVCLAERDRSNTPLQALATLNDPVFVECAQALGRDLAVLPGTPEERLQVAGMRCLSRRFSQDEADVLASLLASEQLWYRDRPAEARQSVGDYSAAEVADATTAAWLAVARAILNLDEFVTRE